MDNGQQMVIIGRINLDKQVVVSRRIMAFHHLWNLFQFLHDGIKRLRMLQIQADESTGLKACLLYTSDAADE